MTTTVLERIVATFGPGPSVPAIEAKLEFARAALPTLRTAVAGAAFNVEDGVEDAQQTLDAARAALCAGQERISDLELVLQEARSREGQATEASREKLRQSQRIALRNHLTARLDAAEKFSAALSTVVEAWHEIAAETDEIANVLQAMGVVRLLPGSLATFSEIQAAVTEEMYRAGGGSQNLWATGGQPALPGVRDISGRRTFNHEDAPALVSSLASANDYLSRTVINPPKETDHE
jgi:hypothetical protein